MARDRLTSSPPGGQEGKGQWQERGSSPLAIGPLPIDRMHSFALVRDGEVLELQLLGPVARVGEELLEEVADQAGLQIVEVALAVAAEADEAGHAHQRQVMADGWLRLGA